MTLEELLQMPYNVVHQLNDSADAPSDFYCVRVRGGWLYVHPDSSGQDLIHFVSEKAGAN